MIVIPQSFCDLLARGEVIFVMNVSGGKDSTACALALREADIPHRRVFADTKWEADETIEYLDYLRSVLGPIDVIGYPGGMPAKIREGARFASRMQRWCTQELKLHPLRAYYDAIEDTGATAVCVTGVRAEEGTAKNGRAQMPEIEDDAGWGGWMWRPIHKWTIADVLEIHHRHGVRVNPLYHRGHDRVGCYPCVMASKEEVRLIAEHAPERIAEIRALEQEVTAERLRRNEETPGRYSYPVASFFLRPTNRDTPDTRIMDIDAIVRWAQTARGGRQLPMFPPVPDGGCFRWASATRHHLAPTEPADG